MPAGDTIGQIAQQGGLADARLAGQHRHAAPAITCVVQEPVEDRTFATTTTEAQRLTEILTRHRPPSASTIPSVRYRQERIVGTEPKPGPGQLDRPRYAPLAP